MHDLPKGGAAAILSYAGGLQRQVGKAGTPLPLLGGAAGRSSLGCAGQLGMQVREAGTPPACAWCSQQVTTSSTMRVGWLLRELLQQAFMAHCVPWRGGESVQAKWRAFCGKHSGFSLFCITHIPGQTALGGLHRALPCSDPLEGPAAPKQQPCARRRPAPAGQDASREFDPIHSIDARKMTVGYLIGRWAREKVSA